MKSMRIQGAIAVALALAGCTPNEAPTSEVAPCPTTAVRIAVASDGGVFLNDKAVAAADLKKTLEGITPRPTAVCYTRENLNGAPPTQMTAVLDTIVELGLSISFYTDRSFRRRIRLR